MKKLLLVFALLVNPAFSQTGTVLPTQVSILGKNVPAETVRSSYESARVSFVYERGMPEPVTPDAYLEAWETAKAKKEEKEREKKERRKKQNDRQSNGNRSNSSRSKRRTITVDASVGLHVNDREQPEFEAISGIIAGRRGRHILVSDAGSLYAVESRNLQPGPNGEVSLMGKRDPKRKILKIRKPGGEQEFPVYIDMTLSFNDFIRFARKGTNFPGMPVIERPTRRYSDKGTNSPDKPVIERPTRRFKKKEP